MISPTPSDQECWMIERFVNGHTEWFSGWANDAYGLNAGPSSVWVADAFQGVRFSREQDALNVMSGQGDRFHFEDRDPNHRECQRQDARFAHVVANQGGLLNEALEIIDSVGPSDLGDRIRYFREHHRPRR